MRRIVIFSNLLLKYKITLTVCFFLVFVISYVIIRVFIYPPTLNTVSYANNNFHVLGLNIPRNLEFCGEKIPTNDYRIRRQLEKEFFTSTYWKNNSVLIFNRAQRWFPYIEPILKREGIPDDFKYLAVIESHLSNVTSPAGAAGFWQLVPVTAANFGLEVNEFVDERYDVEKATYAATKHIKQGYNSFKNWTLSAAGYNRGIGGIQKALRNQKGNSYYDLLLNPETGSFVYRILAYKTLLSDPSHYGIKKKKLVYAGKVPVEIHKVDSTIHDLKDFAAHLGCNLVTLKVFNPWLLKNSLPNPAKKNYLIRVPKKKNGDYSAYARDLLPEGDVLLPYAGDSTITSSAAADTLLQKTIYHVVKINEPLSKLAEFFDVKVEDLKKWNKLKDDQAVAGQTLTIRYPLHPAKVEKK